MFYIKFLIKRAVHGFGVVVAAITVIFALRVIYPGDIVAVLAPPEADQATREQIRNELGLNDPLYEQYVEYLAGLARGDLGYSYISDISANTLVSVRIVPTLELMVVATIIAVGISIPLGIISAKNRNEPKDYFATGFSLVGISTPNFWLGIMLILLLAVTVGIFPTSQRPIGFGAALSIAVMDQNLVGLKIWAEHIILPAITLGTYFTALITRLTRSGMIEEMGKPYIEASKAKGLPESYVMYKHAFRNTLLPIITVIGLQIGGLINGAVITETIFAWPGLGSLFINSVHARDWPVIQAILIFVAVGWVVINTTVDATYSVADPRVDLE